MEGATADRAQSASSAISRDIVKLHAKLYGRGPTKAKTYIHPEFVLCALDDVFTASEATLIEAGREDLVRQTRVVFQESTRGEFVGIVERVTGRRVRSFHSQIDVESNTVIEAFLLAPAGAEMEAVEAPDPTVARIAANP